MSKLLPLEYCKLDRAARMLGCEVQDIIHWAAVGAIDLCVKDIGTGQICENIRINGIAQNSSTLILQAHDVSSIKLSEYTSLSAVNRLIFSYELNDLPTIEIIRQKISFRGFWVLTQVSYLEANESMAAASILVPYASIYDLYGTLSAHSTDEPEMEPITQDDLWILRPELEKLKRAIDEGSIYNIYNNAELAQKNKELELNAPPEIASRVTVKQSDMIKALILTNSELEPLVDNASGLLTELEKLCAKKGIKTPVSDAKTIRDWLSRASIRKVQ